MALYQFAYEWSAPHARGLYGEQEPLDGLAVASLSHAPAQIGYTHARSRQRHPTQEDSA
jgi:hypothetical protein